MADLMRALEKKLEGDIAVSKANIAVYNERPAGVGEQPEIVQALEMEISKLADAEDKLNTVKNLLHPKSMHLTE